MSGSVNEVLQGIVGRHGRVLLDDHRRCESCLRDTSLAAKEIFGVMAALKAGIPKRLAAMPEIGEKGIANFAAELADTSGLNEQVARSSVTAWAFALRPQGAGTTTKPVEEGKDRKTEKMAVPAPAQSSLGEAIVAAIAIPVIFYAAHVYGTFKVFGMEIPAFIFALIVLVKGLHSISNYLAFRFRNKAQ